MRALGRLLAAVLMSILLAILTLWGVLSFVFCSWPTSLSYGSIALYLGGTVITFVAVRSWRRKRNVLLALFGGVLVAWFAMRPSNDREWDEPVAVTAHAEIMDDSVIVYNVRNFSYTSATNYTPAYEDRAYDLRQLEHVDVYLVNWGIEQISHAMVSFGFGDSDYLCFSFETRKEKGESYSALKGFFRKYE